MASHFTELNLRAELIDGIQRASFQSMTPIQAAALPTMLTGSRCTWASGDRHWKTAAFALSVLNRIDSSKNQLQALVLCPTRELADYQVAKEFRMLASRLENTRVLSICGGRPLRQQIIDWKRGAQIIVGTPGRILHHLKSKDLSVAAVGALVLDEADRMLDMGFSEDVNEIVRFVPSTRQTLLFSATFPDAVLELSQTLQNNPEHISVGSDEPSRFVSVSVYSGVRSKNDLMSWLICWLIIDHRPCSFL